MADDSIAVADPATRTVRQCADLCTTCIYRTGNRMHLAPGRLAQMTRDAIKAESHVVCHETTSTPAPAICAGYARLPLARARCLALRVVRAGVAVLELITPTTSGDPRA